MSLLAEPEYLLFEIWPPYETKLEVLGEKAIQLRHILSIKVFLPIVTLIVSCVPCRLVGAAETWRAPLLLSRLKPFRKTLMTGCWFAENAWTKFVLTTAQFSHLLLGWRLAEWEDELPTSTKPTWISGLLLTQKLTLADAQTRWVYSKRNCAPVVVRDAGLMPKELGPTKLSAKLCRAGLEIMYQKQLRELKWMWSGTDSRKSEMRLPGKRSPWS